MAVMVKTLITGLLRAFLLLATLYHGLLILSSLFWPQYPVPRDHPWWSSFLDPMGASPESFQVYFLALAANLVRDTAVLAVPGVSVKGFWFRKVGVVDISLAWWACLEGVSLYCFARGLTEAKPPYLEDTLGACALLWAGQKLVLVALQKNRPSRTSRVSPSIQTSPVGVSEPKIERLTGPTPRVGLETPASTVSTPPVLAAPPPKRRASGGKSLGGRPRKESNQVLERRILDLIAQKGQAKVGELIAELGAPRRTINRCQEKLLKEGRLERFGKGAGAAYRIKADPGAQPASNK